MVPLCGINSAGMSLVGKKELRFFVVLSNFHFKVNDTKLIRRTLMFSVILFKLSRSKWIQASLSDFIFFSGLDDSLDPPEKCMYKKSKPPCLSFLRRHKNLSSLAWPVFKAKMGFFCFSYVTGRCQFHSAPLPFVVTQQLNRVTWALHSVLGYHIW